MSRRARVHCTVCHCACPVPVPVPVPTSYACAYACACACAGLAILLPRFHPIATTCDDLAGN